MRTFVALNPSPAARAALWDATAPIRDALGRAVAWVAGPMLHLTLKFLGERPPEFAEQLAHTIRESLGDRAGCIDAAFEGVGAFPSPARPRVLWVGVRPNPAFALLYHTVEEVCERLGAPREQRAFHPHVTLGRVRPYARVDRFAALAAEASVSATDRICSLDVMKSTLGPHGARHEVVASVALVRENG